MDLLNVGIIGFGRIGAEHAGWIARAQAEGAPICAYATTDATPARAAMAQARGLKVYATLDELLDDPRVHVVLVSTPTAMHRDHAGRALRAGRHVMIEKPMALNLGEALELVNVAKQQNVVLSVFHNRRWDIDYLTVQHHVRANTFGRLINVESRLGQWASCVGPAAREYRPQWRNEAGFGGGGLYDWGSHFLDQIWRLVHPARPIRLYAQLRGNVWTHDCDDFARVTIDFDNGCAALVEINTTTTRPGARWHIDGANGSASSPPSPEFDTHTWAALDFTPAPAHATAGAEGEAPRRLEMARPGLSEAQIWGAMARAIRRDGPAPVPAETVLPTMLLLDAARESAAAGHAIALGNRVEWQY